MLEFSVPGGTDGKEDGNVETVVMGSILGSSRSPGEANSNLFQYCCLRNPMDKGAWWAIVHGVSKSRT